MGKASSSTGSSASNDTGSTSSSNTSLSNTMELAKEKIQYDNAAKKLLSEKIILAWIMNQCLDEYQGIPVEDIVNKYINGVPQISSIPVEQDVEAKKDAEVKKAVEPTKGTEVGESSTPRIPSGGTEDVSIQEGTVTFDIRFNAIVPTIDGVIRLIINLESQNDYYPGYPLVTRGIYYGSRMISAQSGTVFWNANYEKMQKVYSVWICTNPPKHRENTITAYRIVEDNIVG